MKKTLTFLLALAMLFTLTACDSQKKVDVEYNICSDSYPCDSAGGNLFYPVRFNLPEDHGTMQITLCAAYAGGFVKSMTDALFGMPESYGKYYTKTTTLPEIMDVISSGIDVIATVIEKDEKTYYDFTTALAQGISGFQPASYYCSFVGSDGQKIVEESILIGKTTYILSENVRYIDVYSTVLHGDTEYTEGSQTGKIGYEDAFELEDAAAAPKAPKAGVSPDTSSAQPSATSKAPDSGYTGDFAIEGKWKSVGKYGFGQAQPGAIVVFDGVKCNYYSPQDTYAFYKNGGSYQLDLTSLLFSENLSFKVKVIHQNQIEIYNGSTPTVLKRVS